MEKVKCEQRYLDKLYEMAERFTELYREKKYMQAKYVYDTAQRVAVFLELEKEEMYKLFGHGDDGSEEIKYDELFRRDFVTYINWKCCIFQNKTYQDQACRRLGEPVKYYSDDDYCAICKKRTTT